MKDKLMLKSAILEDTPSDVNKFLISLSELDDNLNGKNRENALWDKAKESGFKSNLDYIMDCISKEPDGAKKIEQFVDMWLSDKTRYKQQNINIERKARKLFVSIAYLIVENE